MNILLIASKMNYGGAESHIFSLASALLFCSHKVTLLSEGGETAERLSQIGVKTLNAPLSKKDPISLARSFFTLKKLCENEKFDVIHAHTRIAALVADMLSRLKKADGTKNFVFVTTAHALFDACGLKGAASVFGEQTIAVSHDIKAHLIKSFNVPKRQITVINNGIDTERFKPSAHVKNGKSLIFVSRMDKDSSRVAELLIELTPRLKARYPDFCLTLVGGGDNFRKIAVLSEKAEQKAGQKCIYLLGNKSDLYKILPQHDLFVGVSRAALEAIFCGLPVILGGNEGYLGFLDESKLEIAKRTNFCCRGCPPPRAQRLFKDICRVFDKKAVSHFTPDLIKEDYSAESMAKKTAAVYKKAIAEKKSKDARRGLIFNGYYGYGNLGDEECINILTKKLGERFPDVRISVLSAARGKKDEAGINHLQRYSLPKIVSEMKHSSLTLIGGGTVLQDKTSLRSLLYYIFIMRLARACGNKTALYANGLGPLKRGVSRLLVKDILYSADYISFRDKKSLTLAKKLCEQGKAMHLGADIAFLAEPPQENPSLPDTDCPPNKYVRYIAVSVRPHSKRLEEQLMSALKSLKERHGLFPLFFVMQEEKDLAVSRRLQNAVGGRIIVPKKASELVSILSRTSLSVGMRLHFLIFSILASCPTIPIAYDEKITALANALALPSPLLPNNLKASDVINRAEQLLYSQTVSLARTKTLLEMQKKSARVDFEEFCSFVEKAIDTK